MDSKKLQKIILNDLQDLVNHNGDVIMTNHYRWTRGIPQYNLNQEKLIQSINDYMSENKGFYIIGNYFDGLSVSDCINKGKVVSSYV